MEKSILPVNSNNERMKLGVLQNIKEKKNMELMVSIKKVCMVLLKSSS